MNEVFLCVGYGSGPGTKRICESCSSSLLRSPLPTDSEISRNVSPLAPSSTFPGSSTRLWWPSLCCRGCCSRCGLERRVENYFGFGDGIEKDVDCLEEDVDDPGNVDDGANGETFLEISESVGSGERRRNPK
jgi:hypothetical protein